MSDFGQPLKAEDRRQRAERSELFSGFWLQCFMDSLIQNLAETLVYIRDHGPEIAPEEIERRRILYQGEPSNIEPKDLFAGLYKTAALARVAIPFEEDYMRGWTPGNLDRFFAVRRSLLMNPPTFEDLQWARQELSRPHALIMLYHEQSMSDGAAACASQDYLNPHNAPPYDTWVQVLPQPGQYGAALIAWVPEWAHDLVNAGIRVIPEECLLWVQVQHEGDHLYLSTEPTLDL